MGLAAVPGHSCRSEVGAQSCSAAELSLGNKPCFCLDYTSNAVKQSCWGLCRKQHIKKEQSRNKWNLALGHPIATSFTLMKLHFCTLDLTLSISKALLSHFCKVLSIS